MSTLKNRSPKGPTSALATRPLRFEGLEARLYLAGQATYNWQHANIGGGGYIDGIFFDPNNQNVVYARTDVGGLYKSTNDGATWNQLLNFVGNSTGSSGNGTQFQEFGVLGFAIDPQNSNNLYADVGEYSWANGNVLYSTDAGQTWNTTALPFWVGGNSNGRGDGEQIAVDPNNSNIIYLGSNDHGLWKSTDAGHSFTQVSSFSPTSTTFVLFNSSGGVSSGATQNIFVGIDSTSTGTNLYQTTNGGTTWSQVTGSGTRPSKYLAGHAVISGGYMYLGYATDLAPTGSFTNGGLYRYQLSTGTWANISPKATNGSFGYNAVAADPNNPNTIVVASFNYYSGPDRMWRTVNANAASPTWYEPYQVQGYGGYNTTRNTTSSPYMAIAGDGIGNWVDDIAINPFNSNQLMYGGITVTNNISNNGTNTPLTAPNSWYYSATGIEMTAVLGLAAPPSGVPLIAAMGDISGFDFTTLTSSPIAGATAATISGGGFGTMNSIDYAGNNPNIQAIVGSIPNGGAYTTNDGTTWTAFASHPGTNGDIVVSADGSSFVWEPSGSNVYYSTNQGSTWTQSTLTGGGALPTGGTLISDKVNPNYIYYWTENASDNQWTLYISSNAGQTFAASSGGPVGTGNVYMIASPFVAGQLWIISYIGLYESTNFGASFNHIGGYNYSGSVIALGAPAPGRSNPALYMYGTPSGTTFQGIYRSDDGGSTWILLNNVNLQWGGTGLIAADPNIFGRIYAGNGGIVIGNPATSLPAGWTDTDINTPGNPGWATNSLTLSNGTTVNQWNLAGGGAGFSSAPIAISSLSRTAGVATAVTSTASGLQVGQTITISGANQSDYNGTFVVTSLSNTSAGLANKIGAATSFTFAIANGTDTATGTITATLADQFNFAYKPVSGGASISTKILGMTNADGGAGTPQAGVMFRAGATPVDVFAALMQTTGNQLTFQYRTTTGGAISTVTLGSVPIGAEYIELTRSGNNFAAYYSSDNINWTQLGSTVAIAAMPLTANVGLAATASFNPQLTSATFASVTIRLKGDINLDGHVNAADLGTLMQALADQNAYTTSNNLSLVDAANILDINSDGYVSNADLQALLNFLQSGGGSSSKNENVTAPVDTTAPLLPTLITSLQVNAEQTATPSADSTLATEEPSLSDTKSGKQQFFSLVDANRKNDSTLVSTTAVKFTKHPAAKTGEHVQNSLPWVDFYFSRLDYLASIKKKRPAGHITEAAHEALADVLMKPLAD